MILIKKDKQLTAIKTELKQKEKIINEKFLEDNTKAKTSRSFKYN